MRAFIYDHYGYYFENEDDNEFDYQGWHFVLEDAGEKSEEEIVDLDNFIDEFTKLFPLLGVKIIKGRNGNYLSSDQSGNLILVAYKNGSINLHDIFKIHKVYLKNQNDEPYLISHLLSLWEEKIALVEEKIIPSLKIDDYYYQKIMVVVIFALGLSKNAIQYLSDIKEDYDDQIIPLTLAHRRLDSLAPKHVLDPLNLIIDSPIRDLSELFKSKVINSDQLIQYVSQNQYTSKEVSLLLSRILFSSQVFDLLEKQYLNRENIKNNLLYMYHHLNEELDNIIKIEHFFVKQYQIRPISWMH